MRGGNDVCGRQNQPAAGPKDPMEFGHRAVAPFEILDDTRGADQVERFIGEGKRLDVSSVVCHVVKASCVRAGEAQHVWRCIERVHPATAARELRHEVSGSATRVQNRRPIGQVECAQDRDDLFVAPIDERASSGPILVLFVVVGVRVEVRDCGLARQLHRFRFCVVLHRIERGSWSHATCDAWASSGIGRRGAMARKRSSVCCTHRVSEYLCRAA